jgi:hypothetical protein
VLERSGAAKPDLLPHVLLRVGDVMRDKFPLASHGDAVREVGLIMHATRSTSSRSSTARGRSWA